MADVSLVWNNDSPIADWSLTNGGDIVTGSDLETAVILSLFTFASQAGPIETAASPIVLVSTAHE